MSSKGIMRGTWQAILVIALGFVHPAAFAQTPPAGKREDLDVTMRVIVDPDAKVPDEIVRRIPLPKPGETSAPAEKKSDKPADTGAPGQQRAAEAREQGREFGQQVSEQAKQRSEEARRNADPPRGPPAEPPGRPNPPQGPPPR